MELLLRHNLPFVTITAHYKGASVKIADVLIDTGSGTTILSADTVAPIGIAPMPDDMLHTIRGVGGIEAVFRRSLDCVQIGGFTLAHFPVDIGGMDYGFAINGILGMDILSAAGAIINLQAMTIDFSEEKSV